MTFLRYRSLCLEDVHASKNSVVHLGLAHWKVLFTLLSLEHFHPPDFHHPQWNCCKLLSLILYQSMLSKMSDSVRSELTAHALQDHDLEPTEVHSTEANETAFSANQAIMTESSEPKLTLAADMIHSEEEVRSSALKLATAADLGLLEEDLPSNAQDFGRFPFDSHNPRKQAQHIVALCTVQMYNRKRGITSTEKQNIFNILQSLNSIGKLTAIDSSLNIRGMLSNILGETSRPTEPYEYPEPLQRNAAIIRERLDSEVATEMALSHSMSPEPDPERVGRKRRRRPSESQPQTQRPLPVDDPTFKHIMRGIFISEGSRRVYSLDWETRPPPRDCDVVGHNGVTIGQWWPLRACVRRDGAHGAIMAGIAGGATTGAYSIVISSILLLYFPWFQSSNQTYR